jgi:pantothenate kinase
MHTPPELLGPARAAVERAALERAAVERVAGARTRTVVGIAGAPAAGKSTLARALVAVLCEDPPVGLQAAESSTSVAVAVPMDGFHLSNAELDRLGLADRKGAPETFDAVGLVHLLRRIRDGGELVYAPAYSRVLHESIGGAIPVPPQARIVVVEGNYLLMPTGAWAGVRPLLDLALFIEAPRPARIDSLLRRQLARGLDDAHAHDWVHRSDEANAKLIEATKAHADLVLRRST